VHDIFDDPRIRSVWWRDLWPVTRLGIFRELLLPASWLAASLAVASTGRYAIALAFSFMFFLTGLRIVHMPFTPRSDCRAARRLRVVDHEHTDAGSMHASGSIICGTTASSPGKAMSKHEAPRCRHGRAAVWPRVSNPPARHCIPVRWQEIAHDSGSGTPVERRVYGLAFGSSISRASLH